MSKLGDRISWRFLAVGGLVVGLLIPLFLVGGIATERQQYYQTVVADIAQGWGSWQSVRGPLIVIPAINTVVDIDKHGKMRSRDVAVEHVLLPKRLSIQGELQHQYRHRAIYEVPVYLMDLVLSGDFSSIDKTAIEKQHKSVQWHQAKLVIGVTDTRAIKSTGLLQMGNTDYELQPGTSVNWLGSGIHVPVQVEAVGGPFRLQLQLAGTGTFDIATLGNNTDIELTGSWPHPKFQGQFLPSSYELSNDGFRADWSVSALARGVTESFEYQSTNINIQSLNAGVRLHDPVTIYTTVDRGIKYGILFIGLTFITFLCFELTTGVKFHFVQYGTVGVGLILFYLTLLSLSEHIAFVLAYVGATAVIVSMLSIYAWAISRSVRTAVVFAAIESILYWVLYVLLQLEDYALITGTGVLLVGLAAVMYVTRQLNQPQGENRRATAALSDT